MREDTTTFSLENTGRFYKQSGGITAVTGFIPEVLTNFQDSSRTGSVSLKRFCGGINPDWGVIAEALKYFIKVAKIHRFYCGNDL
jgi:hypothetical protein